MWRIIVLNTMGCSRAALNQTKITVLIVCQFFLVNTGCYPHGIRELTPSFTIIEVTESSTGAQLANIPVAAIGVGVKYPGWRSQDVISSAPTDHGGQTVIPVGVLAGQEGTLEFDVVISLPTGDDIVRVQNRNGFVGRAGSVVVTVVDVIADAPELNLPTVIVDSETATASIISHVSEIVVCGNTDSRIRWRMDAEVANGQFVSDIVLENPILGFVDTNTDGGFVGANGEIDPPACPFQVLGTSDSPGFTLGILGPFSQGEFKLSNVFLLIRY